MKSIITSFVKGFRAHDSSCQQASVPAKPLFATGHENESVEAHLGTINDDSKDGFGNTRLDEGSEQANTVATEKKIPPAF